MRKQGSSEREIEQALNRWELSAIDSEERSPASSVQDRDPVRDIFDSVGIQHMHAAASSAASSVFGAPKRASTKKKVLKLQKPKKK